MHGLKNDEPTNHGHPASDRFSCLCPGEIAMTFNDRLNEICQVKQSHVCVGLDAELDKIPAFLKTLPDPLFQFCRAIIDATESFAAAYKINTAFFEAYGVTGWKSLNAVAEYLPSSTLKIADAKRGDIGNTSRMYARAFFDELHFDAITVNPYLGYDSIAPFIQNEEKGVFVLCLTSNESAGDFQYMNDGQHDLFERVAMKTMGWNERNNCGLVVGATKADQLKRLRSMARSLPFLIPGIGAQGGDLELAVHNVFLQSTDMALFNSSRGIIYASSDINYAEVAAQKTSELRDHINQFKFT